VVNTIVSQLYKPHLTLRARLALGLAALLFIFNLVLILFINITTTLVVENTSSVVFMGPSQATDSPGATLATAVEIAQQASLQNVRRVSVLGLVIITALGVSGASLIVGRALRPLKAIAKTAQDVSANRLGTRLGLSGPDDEIKQMADAFDVMLARLDNAFKQQGRFVSDAAHELRTPLASMRTTLDVTQSDPHASLGDYQDLAEVMSRNLARLENTVTDLLTLAREERNLTREPVAVEELVSQVLDDMSGLVRTSQVSLRLNDVAGVTVCGNGPLLTRVFDNLVENGIRYNRAGGEVVVSVKRDGEWAEVTVADTGAGISSREQARVFERLYRSENTQTQHKGGAGLGLAIAAYIVQCHAGQIDVQSKPGAGSIFTVKLPAFSVS
jgi:signal transduction histidine kinase